MNRHTFAGACIAAFSVAVASGAVGSVHTQRHKPGTVHNLEATSDKGVAHPDTFALTGPGTITCVRAITDVINPNPAPACKIVANGFTGTMGVKSNATLNAGQITPTCAGPAAMLRCDARVDIADAQQ